METFNQGLLISLYGIGITFLVLAVVIVLIRLIVTLFPVKTSMPALDPDLSEDPNLPDVVAFAAAWWLSQRREDTLGSRLEEPPRHNRPQSG